MTFWNKKEYNDEHLYTFFHKYARTIGTSAMHSLGILMDNDVTSPPQKNFNSLS